MARHVGAAGSTPRSARRSCWGCSGIHSGRLQSGAERMRSRPLATTSWCSPRRSGPAWSLSGRDPWGLQGPGTVRIVVVSSGKQVAIDGLAVTAR